MKNTIKCFLKIILESKMKQKEIEGILNNLDIKLLIEYLITLEEYRNINMNNYQRLLNVLSKNDLYSKIVIENLKRIPNSSMIDYIKIEDKKYFLKILKKEKNINFFLKNYKKFNYTKKENELISSIFYNKVFNLKLREKENIIEKGFFFLDLLRFSFTENLNIKELNFYKLNISKIKEESNIFKSIYQNFVVYVGINKINSNELFNFLKSNINYLEIFNKYLEKHKKYLQSFNNYELEDLKKIEKVIKLYECELYKEQLENF